MLDKNNKNNKGDPESLLEEILSASADQEDFEENKKKTEIEEENLEKKETEKNKNDDKSKKKTKKPMTFFWFLKVAWALLIVLLIITAGFLTYMILNPEQAQFFKTFGILPSDIAKALDLLVRYSFWILTAIISVIWMIVLLRAILTKKEYKRKKTLYIILSIFVAIILILVMTVWYYLFNFIRASDYANPNWWVVLYDNSRLNSSIFNEETSKILSTSNILTPLEVKFDIKPEARLAERDIYIDWFEIDFDWKWWYEYTGKNPFTENNLLYTYKWTWLVTPKWKFVWKDKITWKKREVEIRFKSLNLIWEIIVKEFKERTWWVRVFFDASNIASFGKITWYRQKTLEETWFDTPDWEWPTFTANNHIFKEEEWICLSITNQQNKKPSCYKVFIVWKENNAKWMKFTINYVQAPKNYKIFRFSVSNIIWEEIWVSKYEWEFDWSSKKFWESVEHTFNEAWKHIISLTLTDKVWNKTTIDKEIKVEKPLILREDSRIKIFLQNELVDSKFDQDTRTYLIEDINLPTKAILNAEKVRVKSRFWKLEKVEWDSNNDWEYNITEKVLNLDINKETVYIIPVKMTFKSLFKNMNWEIETKYIEQKIILNAEKPVFRVILNTTQNSDYIPTYVQFDASASEYLNWEITKYIYNFGNWETKEWDARMKYRYTKEWEYNVSVTAITNDWKQKTLKKKLILKKEPAKAKIWASTSEWIIWRPIDFKSTWSTWQIQAYYWKFWDWITSREPNPSYVYNKAGEYKVTLMITLKNWIVLEDSIKIYISE